MSIIFDHAVKYNGRYYPPNTPIDEEVSQETVEDTQKDSKGEGNVNTLPEKETVRKATGGRKKGGAK